MKIKRKKKKKYCFEQRFFWSVSLEWAFISSRTRGQTDEIANKHIFPLLVWSDLEWVLILSANALTVEVTRLSCLSFTLRAPGCFEVKHRSESSEALEEGKGADATVWKSQTEQKPLDRRRCVKVVLMSSTCTCFPFIRLTIWTGSTSGARTVLTGRVGTQICPQTWRKGSRLLLFCYCYSWQLQLTSHFGFTWTTQNTQQD